jgi:encore-like protein
MKESASPPRTPNSHSPSDMKSHSPTAPTLLTSDESQQSTSSAQHLSAPAPTFVLPLSEVHGGKSQLDIDFPKLTPPKTKVGWNGSQNSGSRNNRKSVSSDTSSNNNSLCEDVNESHDKAAQQQQYKSGSQTISISPSASINHHLQSPQSDRKQRHQQQLSFDNEYEKGSTDSYNPNEERSLISPSRSQCKSPSYPQNDNYNHNNNSNTNGGSKSINTCSMNVKGKPPLKNMGSSSSFEGGNTSSGFISRDSSSEQFVDQNGIDLVQFFKETLNKNAKDRNMLMKIERELLQLAVDQT